jgi:DNA-binding HxlR family transcriptional regulator
MNMPTIKIVTVNELQKHILDYLLANASISCNMAGDRLAKAGLLKRTPTKCSNLCLPGGAVLRSLERLGFVRKFFRPSDPSPRFYALSRRGRLLAEQLRKVSTRFEKATVPS